MSRNGVGDDVSVLLYLVPFAASGVSGLVLWVQSGISAFLPKQVYLTVTRDPILFVVASLSVMLGLVLEVRGSDPQARPTKLVSLSGTLQSMAIASLVLTLVAALYANGFEISGAATDFIVGRYGLVFPGVLVLLSYLVTIRFGLGSLQSPKVLGIIALLLVPVAIYEIGRRQVALGLLVSLVLIVLGMAPYLFKRWSGAPEPEKQ